MSGTDPGAADQVVNQPAEQAGYSAVMSWVGHLGELRARLIRALLVTVASALAGWHIVPQFLEWIRRPVGNLVFIAPAEAFMAHLQVAIVIGLLLASPYVLWEAWLFVRPGLLDTELRLLRKILPLAYVLFILGGAIGYQILFPVGVRMLLQLADGPVRPAVSVAKYLGVFWSTVLPCAVAFELPLAVVAAVATGLAPLAWLRSQRGAALLLSFIFGGVLSPQGVGMQLLLAVPLFLLFEFGVLLAALFAKESRTN